MDDDTHYDQLAEAEEYCLKAEFVLHGVQANAEVYGSNSASPTPENVGLALQYIDRSLEYFPQNATYLNLKALLLWEGLGDKKNARAILEHASKLAPRDIDIQNNLNAIKSTGCIVATAAFGSPIADHVISLRNWRDRRLAHSIFGRAFVRFYYKIGPFVVKAIGGRSWLRKGVRAILIPIVWAIRFDERVQTE
jgi:tetratricopeptide (TPR) repeat protein